MVFQYSLAVEIRNTFGLEGARVFLKVGSAVKVSAPYNQKLHLVNKNVHQAEVSPNAKKIHPTIKSCTFSIKMCTRLRSPPMQRKLALL